MNRSTVLVSTLAVSALLSGCVGVGPNTQQGAVAGGALGSLAGAIIGHNSRGHDTLGGALLGGTIGAIAGGTLGNSVDNQRGTLYPAPGPRAYRRVVYEEVPPPPPPLPPPAPPPPPASAEIVPPPPVPDALWVPGYWSFDGSSNAWISGHWEVPPPNATTFVTAHWEFQGDRYVFVRSYWH